MLKPFHSDLYFTAITLVISVIVLSLTGLLNRFDHVFYDYGAQLSLSSPPDDIVIVAIDERSLNTLGKWPWSRAVHAQLLHNINRSHPLVIGLDVLFAEPDQHFQQDDQLLGDAILASGKVVLPVVIDAHYQGAPVKLLQSLPVLRAGAAAEGRVNVPLDVDGIARGIYLKEGVFLNEGVTPLLPHFAQSVLQVAGQLPSNDESSSTEQASQMRTSASPLLRLDYQKNRFYGRPGHFRQISYSHVWSGQIPENFFDHKIVLVGATAVGMGDLLPTPVSGFSKPMAGVEYNANVIQSMRMSQMIFDFPMWLTVLCSVILVLVPLSWLQQIKPAYALASMLFYCILVFTVAMTAPLLFGFWWPPSAVLLMILLTYPIWSWRRLERMLNYLNVEFEQLNAELTKFGVEPHAVANIHHVGKDAKYDLLLSRIAQLRIAGGALRDLQKVRNDALAFVSHDLRAPLATAIMLLNDKTLNQDKGRLISMLSHAKQLADNFLNISKVEALNAQGFQLLEINGLMQESVDQLYAYAKSRQVKVNLQVCDDALCVNGEFGVLMRAMLNILHNAIKFSDVGGKVDVSLTHRVQEVMISVTDYGCGISEAQIPLIFEQYKQLNNHARKYEGSGLGMYFVSVTINKHHGRLVVDSELGHFTTFTIYLPLIDSLVNEL